jgi:hypothetical protein
MAASDITSFGHLDTSSLPGGVFGVNLSSQTFEFGRFVI